MTQRPARSRARRLSPAPVLPPFDVPTRLLPERAFVVHLRDRGSPDGASAEISGRVEHVVSGRSAEFRTLAELSRFMKQMMTCRQAVAVAQGTSGRGPSRGPPATPRAISSLGGQGAIPRFQSKEIAR